MNITIDGDGPRDRCTCAGPFPAGSILSPPQLHITLNATGAPGTKITSKFGGHHPREPAPPFADSGFAITPRATRPSSARPTPPRRARRTTARSRTATASRSARSPLLTDTTIIPNTNPLVTITTPADGDEVPPRREVFADYACTETVYALASCVATAPDGPQLDFSTFGQKTFTVTATDANGGVTTQDRHLRRRRQRHRRSSTPAPTITVNGGATVTLHGSATDPDTGQILSYQWTQIGGPPVTLNPDDADDPFEPNQRFVAPRNGPVDLTFRLRVDDGFDTGEDTVVVHVNANNAPGRSPTARPRRSTT